MLMILVLIATCCVLLWLLSSPFYWKFKNVPHLFPLPIFGNSLPLFRMSLKDYYQQLYKKFPNERFFGFHYFTTPTLMLRDPILVKDIFIKDFEHFTMTGFYSNVNADPFADNLLYLHGQSWKEIRTKLSNHFTPSKLRSVMDYVNNSMVKCERSIDESIKNKQPIHCDQLLINVTTDVIVQAVFGLETDCFEKESRFNNIGAKMFCPTANFKMLAGVLAPWLCDIFRLEVFERNMTNFLKNVIEDVMKYRQANKIVKPDFVDTMMNMMNSQKNNGTEKYFPDKTRIPEYDIRTVLSQALILVSGGVESSALSMSFALYEMSINQAIQDKCRDEISTLIKEVGTPIKIEHISRLPYIDMVMKEALRKYPPFGQMPRKCTKRYTLRDTNVTLEPGTLVYTPIRCLQWDPKNFPDPEAFIPERFSEENKRNIDNGMYLPWGLGPRECLGKQFARIEMVLVLARLLNKYRFTINSKTEVPLRTCYYTTATTPDPGIWLDVEPIEGSA